MFLNVDLHQTIVLLKRLFWNDYQPSSLEFRRVSKRRIP